MSDSQRLVMIDPPNPFGTLETWEDYLRELQSLPDDTALKASLIDDAQYHIRRLRRRHRCTFD